MLGQGQAVGDCRSADERRVRTGTAQRVLALANAPERQQRGVHCCVNGFTALRSMLCSCRFGHVEQSA